MKSRFVYAIKFVADMDAAVAFHRDTLGLEVGFTTPFWSELKTGDVTLALHPASDKNPAGTVQLGFRVPDLPGVYERRELDFTTAPKDEHGTLLATARDCEGAEISLSGE